ncbi:MAG TPA: hypothetical protein VK588_13395 [Chitinophagaceae bacterium]|nr:hypothetical protein [Chitinophagaceae bacterium]
MKTLYAVVSYNHNYYHEIADEAQRREIEKLISKLKHLENEIVAVHEGRINISPAGNVFMDSYPPELAKKMHL